MKYTTIIFDFDGTIADTGRGIKNSVKYALTQFNIPIGDENSLNYFIGPPLYESFEHIYGVSPEMSNKLVDTYRIYYAEKGVYELNPYPGILELLKELKNCGIKLAVASSKPKHFLDVLIPYINADKYFDVIIGPELNNHNSDKSTLIFQASRTLDEPIGNQIAMIGDRFYDIEGANKAGVTSIGVTYGYGSKQELLNSNAQLIADNIEDLKNLLL